MNIGSQKKQHVFIYGIVTVGLLLAFGAGTVMGTNLDVYRNVTNAQGDVQLTKVADLYSKTRSPEVSFDEYWNVWDTIQEKYVEQDIDDVSLFYGSIEGMVESLDDPYSVYFPPVQAKEFAQNLAGEFEGIGAEIGKKDDQLTVIAPLPSSPAEQAGLRTGDVVLSVDGTDVTGMTVHEAVLLIRGEKGTDVVLGIYRPTDKEQHDITITRDSIVIPTVEWEMKEQDIAYLRLAYFNEETTAEFARAVEEIAFKNPSGIILDMRGNPGGYLSAAVYAASEWVEEGVIVRERYRDGSEKVHNAVGMHRLKGIPTVALVDGGTASGSEIVAGALQDYEAATIMGQQTFGKGSVQQFQLLPPSGAALKLTVAKWYTPEMQEINGVGVTPDVIIEDMYTKKEGAEGTSADDYDDNGLAEAMNYLTQ
jgi:carboxyl-terminal processing protease